MASPATSAPGISPRTPRSISIDPRSGRARVSHLLLAAVLLVLVGMTGAGVAPSSQDRVDDGRRVLGEVDVALAGLTGAEAARPGPPLADRDDVLAAPIAGRAAVARGITETQATVEPRSGHGPQAGPASAAGTAPRTSIAAGLVGLLVTAGAATAVSRSTTREEVGTTSRAPDPTTTSVTLPAGAEKTPAEAVARAALVERVAGVAQRTELPAPDVADAVRELGKDTAGATADVDRPSGLRVPGSASPTGRNGAPRAATLVATAGYAAARSRAHGPTTALWHAVELRRPDGALGGPCEIAVCGSLVRVSTEERWPVAARGVCPACATVAR